MPVALPIMQLLSGLPPHEDVRAQRRRSCFVRYARNYVLGILLFTNEIRNLIQPSTTLLEPLEDYTTCHASPSKRLDRLHTKNARNV
jgi:hypothetical protein